VSGRLPQQFFVSPIKKGGNAERRIFKFPWHAKQNQEPRRDIMKHIFTSLLIMLFILVFYGPGMAQDTLDVPYAGIGTLNTMIKNDTLPDGSRNPNRVYRLARGQIYLINGTLTVPDGYPMRLVASNGDGARPMMIPVTEEGLSSRLFEVTGDGEWKSIYMTNVDDLGNNPVQAKNMFRLVGENSRYYLYDVFIDGESQGVFRMNSANERLFLVDCIFRNMCRVGDPWDGLGIAARGGFQDTIMAENCTFYAGSNRVIQCYGGTVKNMIFNHCTFAYFGGVTDGNFDTGQTINLTFTNNVLWDIGFEGEDNPENPVEMLPIDDLTSVDFGTNDDRNIKITNNVYGWTPAVMDWINSKPTGDGPDLDPFVFQDSLSDSLINVYPNMVSENNIMADLTFSDPPDVQVFIGYAEYRYADGYQNTSNPDMRIDRNGIGPITEIGTLGLSDDEPDFDYNTDSDAYTQAEDGFPAGDLNWFPEKKSEWMGVSAISEQVGVPVPEKFDLGQNYPNPFNPTTTIEFRLNKAAKVNLTVYNALGQEVKVLVNNQSQKAGSYSVTWDGRDQAGNFVASGIYFYRLNADNLTMSKKMLMLK